MIDFDLIIPFSRAIDTVLLINRFNRSISFKRSLRNLVSELELITSSSGAISRKYLKDMSYLERSTTSTSDTVSIVFKRRYLNILIGLSALRPLVWQYLVNSSS